jgi:hypothetical protein
LRLIKVNVSLKIQPESRRRACHVREANCHFCSNRATAINDLIDWEARNLHCVGQSLLRNAASKYPLAQYLTGADRRRRDELPRRHPILLAPFQQDLVCTDLIAPGEGDMPLSIDMQSESTRRIAPANYLAQNSNILQAASGN